MESELLILEEKHVVFLADGRPVYLAREIAQVSRPPPGPVPSPMI